jgi:hypothetical protein
MAVVRSALYLGWVTMEHSVANTYYDGPASVQLWHDSRCCKKPLTHITLSTLKDESFAMGVCVSTAVSVHACKEGCWELGVKGCDFGHLCVGESQRSEKPVVKGNTWW